MKISALELFLVPPRWLFLKLSTDSGISGWGEPILEGHTEAVAAAVRAASEYLVGQDPTRIEEIWQVLYRGRFYRGGSVLMSAMAGIDQALWDVKGKHYGVPIHEFLGGRVRDKIRVYAWIGGDSPSEVAPAARRRMAEGFTAVKMNASSQMHYIDSFAKVDDVLARVGAVREATGKSFDIAIDFHGRIHKTQSDLLDYLADPAVFAYQDGHVAVPHGPGLGITINEEAVRRAAVQGHAWRNPVWRTDDGSVAEW